MPLPRKTASSKTALKTRNQISSSTLCSPRPCFIETVEICDSDDDDFVTPNPSTVKFSEKSFNQQIPAAAAAVGTTNGDVTGFGRDFINAVSTPAREKDNKFTFKLKSNRTDSLETKIPVPERTQGIRVSSSIFSKSTTDSWKDLMVRMQLNQKTGSHTTKKSNLSASLKLRRNKNKTVVKKVASTSTLTQQGFQRNFIDKSTTIFRIFTREIVLFLCNTNILL